MIIDYSSFSKAIEQLEKSLSYLHSEMSQKDADLRLQFRAAVIQAFEYTYELSVKMIRRQLKEIVANPSELQEINFMDFIRTAFEAGLVQDVPKYRVFREKRNITSHTYDENKAEEVLVIIPNFLQEMHFVLKELQRRNG